MSNLVAVLDPQAGTEGGANDPTSGSTPGWGCFRSSTGSAPDRTRDRDELDDVEPTLMDYVSMYNVW